MAQVLQILSCFRGSVGDCIPFFQMRLGQMMLKATVLSLAIFTLSEVQFSGMVLANEA